MSGPRTVVAALALGAGLAWPAPASAQSAGASCSASSNGVVFGAYDPSLGAPLLSNGSVTVRCAATAGLAVAFTTLLSSGASGNVQNRRMSGGGANLPYNLYTDATYSRVWDSSNGLAGSVELLGAGGLFSGSTKQTVYGRIPALQAVPAGLYADVLVITVNY